MTDVKQFLRALRTADAHNLGIELGNEEVSELRLILSGIASLELQLAEAKAKLAWIPVGERLPEENMTVLVVTKRNRNPVVAWMRLGLWRSRGVDFALSVTHWMPLPQPPEVQE